jgi:drug/metabolite transporter (DMT)-like permease
MVKWWAALALLANAFAWGVSWWPFRQLQTQGVHPLWATALTYLLALVCLLLARPHAWRAFAQHRLLWVLMLASGLTNIGFNWAVTVGDVVRVVLLFYLMPAWSVLLAWPLLGERPRAGALFRLVLALSGVLVVLHTPASPWPWPESLADVLALLGGFFFALTNVLLRRLHAAPVASGMLAMFGGGAVLATLVALTGVHTGIVSSLPDPGFAWMAWVVLLSLLFLVGNAGLQYGAARLRASATSVIMLSEIVFASASAMLLGAGEMNLRTIVGGALIVAAAVWAAVE